MKITQQSETNWMNVCPILASATDSLKTEPPPKYFLFHENPKF